MRKATGAGSPRQDGHFSHSLADFVGGLELVARRGVAASSEGENVKDFGWCVIRANHKMRSRGQNLERATRLELATFSLGS